MEEQKSFAEFVKFQKIPRLSRDCEITEKIDGTNACIVITEDGQFLTGKRSGWCTPEKDNMGFSKWANERKDELMGLGIGRHFGEFYGQGIQRNYDLKEKRFALFNTHKWSDPLVRPKCCGVVPTLGIVPFDTLIIREIVIYLAMTGSQAVPGFMNPEGVVIRHLESNHLYKKTILNDEKSKGVQDE